MRSLLGAPIAERRQAEILNALEFTTTDADDGLDVTVPAFRRSDVTREADLIEEVARLDGLEKLPATLPSRHGASGRLTERPAAAPPRRRRADRTGLARDRRLELHRAGPAQSSAAASGHHRRRAREPDVLRAGAAADDAARLAARRRAATTSHTAPARCACSRPAPSTCPSPAGGCRASRITSAALLIGPVRPATWREPDPPRRRLLRRQGRSAGSARHAPGALGGAGRPPIRSRSCTRGAPRRSSSPSTPVGWLGEIHPQVAAQWDIDIDQTVAAFELDLDAVAPHAVLDAGLRGPDELPRGPRGPGGDRRTATSAADVLAVVREAGAPLLHHAEVFDVYRDRGAARRRQRVARAAPRPTARAIAR